MQSTKCKVSTGVHSIRVYNLESDGGMPKIKFIGMSYHNRQFTTSVHPEECELFCSVTT